MKIFKPTALLFFLFFLSYSYAAVTPQPVHPKFDLNKIKLKDIEKLTGKKLTFFEKIRLKLALKTLKKIQKEEITEQQKKQATASMILGIASLALLLFSFVGIIGILCIPAAILAIVFGAKSLKGNSNAKGIIGVVTGGVTLVIVVLAVILVAIFFSGFSFE